MNEPQSDLNISDSSDDLKYYNNNNIILITSRRGYIYSNYGMTTYEGILKVFMLDPNKGIDELKEYTYGKHKQIMSSLINTDAQIVFFGGEKYVSNRHTLIGLFARAGLMTRAIANIPVNSMISNIELDDSIKYNIAFENRKPTVKDADEIIKKFMKNPSKYKLYGTLAYSIEKFRYLSRIFTADNFDEYKQRFEKTNTELKSSISKEVLKLNKRNLALYIANINSLNVMSKKVMEEVNKLDYNTSHSIRNLVLRIRGTPDISEYKVDEQFKNRTTSHILVKDNLLKYDGMESIASEKYRLVQLELLFSEPEKSYSEFLYENNIGRAELYCTSNEQAHKTLSKISDIIYTSGDININSGVIKSYIEQFINFTLELSKNNILVVYTDNLKIWLMCDKELNREDTLKIINEAINKTYLRNIVYRMHVCDDCICRKQFIDYSDDNTIIIQ